MHIIKIKFTNGINFIDYCQMKNQEANFAICQTSKDSSTELLIMGLEKYKVGTTDNNVNYETPIEIYFIGSINSNNIKYDIQGLESN